MQKILLKNEWTIAALALILFVPFLGHLHLFDWDEINFAESAREMIATGNYFSVQINYTRFTEKPPLFFWLQVLSMKAFGMNEFAARFPNALCGVVTLVSLFRIGKKVFNEQFARVWVMIYLGTLVTFLYFKSGIIDPWFNLFIFLGVYHFYFLSLPKPVKTLQHAFFAGLFLGLAVLTKGPVAILVCLLSYLVMVVLHRFNFFLQWKSFLVLFMTAFVVCFAWFGVDLVQNGPRFLIEFIQRQIAIFSTSDADHGEPFFYHWWVLLLGCFPASIFFIQGMATGVQTMEQKRFKQWMLVLFWVTLLLFSIVKTKIVHYSSLCWFPLTSIAAIYIHQLKERAAVKLHVVLKILLGVIGVVLGLILLLLPLLLMQKDRWMHLVEDAFAKGNLQAQVQWYVWDGIGGLLILFALVYYWMSQQTVKKTQLLFISMTVCCWYTSTVITPKIEAISQRANIDFFEARAGEPCYVETIGYKSYGHFFYTKKQPIKPAEKPLMDSVLYGITHRPDTISSNESEDRLRNWMLHGKLDKPAYFSIKVQDRKTLDTMPDLKFLYEKNGFVFYMRPVAQ